MGNQASQQHASPGDAERAKLEALFQSSGDLVHLQSAFKILSEKRSGATSGSGSARPVMHADLKATFDLHIPEECPTALQHALESLNAQLCTEVFGNAPDGVTYAVFLGGVAQSGRLGSKKEQIDLFIRTFLGSEAGEGKQWREERVQSGGTASTSAPSEVSSAIHASEKISRERLEGILLASWYLTAWNRGQGAGPKGKAPERGDGPSASIQWPDVRALVNGAWESASASPEKESTLTAEQLVSWAVATVPGLSNILEAFLMCKCQSFLSERGSSDEQNKGAEQDVKAGNESSSEPGGDSGLQKDSEGDEGGGWKSGMLTPAVAWSMGQALTSGTAKWGVGPRLIDLGCGGGDLTRLIGHPRLLYRSSENGRGMNRFMSRVEGYTGTVLVIIAARPFAGGEGWSIAALLPDGLANRRDFFGSSSSCLFALKPTFKVFRATGRESNVVFCHAKVAGQGYQTSPLPEGLGLGGSLGKERVWLDDNATPGKVTVRHHAVDKTFQPGALVPDLGYGGVEARVEDVEVWGLGGSQADDKQRAYLEREQRFQEQRRKIDMKKFAESWQDSPDRLILEWGGART
ncbi:TLD family protein [Klebsormidium nitens]|uniref:TLD family protein n=1 Tax=Klebsormidium nitens TaxID=105231 RepID=A0A1Y1I0D1_KLENI|nr:TLD family protein [Klebsormidium nitens]|eukprot:GAQ82889.1 TLD family protein [Klebsormidium nitens]